MDILINDRMYHLPDSISELTPVQITEIQSIHGPELKKQLQMVMAIPAGFEHDLAFAQWKIEKSFRLFSFFTRIDREVLDNCSFHGQIAATYYNKMDELFINRPLPGGGKSFPACT